MNEAESPDIIQTVYTAAQLVADDLEEAARLVERVFSQADPATPDEALAVLRHAAAGMDARRQGVLATRLRREKLDRVVQESLAVLPATRRLAVLEAYLDAAHEHPERTVFLYAVRRGMDERGSLPVTVSDIREALDRTIGASAAPVPPSLRAVVESSMLRRGAHGDAAQGAAGRPPARRRPALRFASALLVILIASLLGIWLGRPSGTADDPAAIPDLFTILGRSSPDDVLFSGSSVSQAERMLADRFGIRAAVPELDGGALESLSVVHAGEESDIPVLRYDAGDGAAIDLFVVPYVYLEDYQFEWAIPTAVLEQIATEDGVDIAVDDGTGRVAWRVRDDIYIAWVNGDATTLRSRFRY